jgi:hypothetical protein
MNVCKKCKKLTVKEEKSVMKKDANGKNSVKIKKVHLRKLKGSNNSESII